jgi:hypothetical protein
MIGRGRTPKVRAWRHNEETGVMRPADSKIHADTRHTGGNSIRGAASKRPVRHGFGRGSPRRTAGPTSRKKRSAASCRGIRAPCSRPATRPAPPRPAFERAIPWEFVPSPLPDVRRDDAAPGVVECRRVRREDFLRGTVPLGSDSSGDLFRPDTPGGGSVWFFVRDTRGGEESFFKATDSPGSPLDGPAPPGDVRDFWRRGRRGRDGRQV